MNGVPGRPLTAADSASRVPSFHAMAMAAKAIFSVVSRCFTMRATSPARPPSVVVSSRATRTFRPAIIVLISPSFARLWRVLIEVPIAAAASAIGTHLVVVSLMSSASLPVSSRFPAALRRHCRPCRP